jgi:hypothetical membrane protein
MTQAARPDFARTESANGQAGTVGLAAADDAFPVCSGQAVPWWAVASSGLSPVLLVGAWLAADAVQPASYSPIRQTISALAGYGGTDRWIMTGALFLVGGCYIVTAVGLASVRGAARILLIVAGLSTIGIAASPESASGPTSQHLAWTVLAAITMAIWPAFAARRPPARPLILGTCSSAAVTAVFAVLLGWLLIEAQGGADLGLAERLTTAAQASWPFVVAVALRRTAHRARRQELPGEQLAGSKPLPATTFGPASGVPEGPQNHGDPVITGAGQPPAAGRTAGIAGSRRHVSHGRLP